MEKAATTFWRTLTNFKCGKWRFWPDIPRTLPLPAPSLCSSHCSSLWHLAGWPACLLTGWRIVATTAQLNVGEAGEVLITKQQAASEAFTRKAENWRGAGQEVARLTGQPFNYAVKHGQRPGSAAEAAVKPGTRKVIATAERWKGRSATTTIVYGKRGLGLLKQVKRWKPVAKAHGKSYLLRLGNPGQQLRLGPCSPAAAHEFKMRRSSGPKLCFQRFYLRKISSRNTPSLPPSLLAPACTPFPSLLCFLAFLFYWAICGRRFNTLAECGLRQAMLSTCFRAKKLLKKSLTAWQQVEMTHREVEENKLGKYPSNSICIYIFESLIEQSDSKEKAKGSCFKSFIQEMCQWQLSYLITEKIKQLVSYISWYGVYIVCIYRVG